MQAWFYEHSQIKSVYAYTEHNDLSENVQKVCKSSRD